VFHGAKMRQLWPILTTIKPTKIAICNYLAIMLLFFYTIFKENKTN